MNNDMKTAVQAIVDSAIQIDNYFYDVENKLHKELVGRNKKSIFLR